MRALIAAASVLSWVLSGCGGKVVFEEEVVDLESACVEFCEASAAGSCPVDPGCASSCDQLVQQARGACEQELGALLGCSAAQLAGGSCDSLAGCFGEAQDYAICFLQSSGASVSSSAGGGP